MLESTKIHGVRKNNSITTKVVCNFCTIADKEYLFKVLTLYHSLERHSKSFHLWICCNDDIVYSILTKMNLKNAIPFSVSDLEDSELLAIKPSRKPNEYCWTIKPCLIKHILNNYDIDSLVYCDGDLYFFSDPEPIFEEWGEKSILLTTQRDLDWVHYKYGTYQAGLIGFKKDKNGLDALEWWRQKCIEWCYGDPQPEFERWGDQKYLDKMPLLFQRVKIAENLGVNAAPWNSIYNNNYNIYESGNDIFIENDKLICFHFSCISIFNDSEFDLWTFMNIPMKDIIRNKFYTPYLGAIGRSIKDVEKYYDGNLDIFFSANKVSEAKTYFKYIPIEVDNLNYTSTNVAKTKVYTTNSPTGISEITKIYGVGKDNPITIKTVCNFCTIAGKEYLFKVLTLYNSLERHSKNFHLWICCNDAIVYSILTKMNLKNATPFPVSDLEDSELLAIKSWRKPNEYCWTIKSSLIGYILNNYDVDSLIYCDGDLFFFSDPEPIFKEWGENSTLLTPQRDLDWVHAKYGTYQAGLIGFKKDKNGLGALEWWRQKCIEWCYGDPQPEFERWGDQKYLDKIPLLFQGVKIAKNLGVNAAPWNSIYNNNYNIYESGNDISIENDKLICFHFACISIFNDSEFDLWTFMNIPMKDIIKNKCYTPYLGAIRKSIQDIKRYYDGNLDIFFSANKVSEAKTYFRYIPTEVGDFNYTSNNEDDTKVYPKDSPVDINNVEVYHEHSPINIKTDTPYQDYNFCSLISNQYMIKQLTMYYSLKKHSENFHLWICCIDDISYNTLLKMGLENVSIVHVREIEDNELLSVKKTRTLTEYCWTLKATLILHLIKKYNLDSIIYCDSDLYFFSDPQVLFDQLQGYSMFMCRQRGDYELEKIHGSFQAGLLGFRNDKNSLDILHWWREKCIEWCSNNPDIYNERWGDQKYLDKVPHLFSSINLIDNLGIDAAPWNLVMNNNYKVNKEDDEVFIENDKLVVYHFGSMLIYNEYEYDLWKLQALSFNEEIINHIYIPYIYDLKNTITSLKSLEYTNANLFFWRNFVESPKNYFKL